MPCRIQNKNMLDLFLSRFNMFYVKRYSSMVFILNRETKKKKKKKYNHGLL